MAGNNDLHDLIQKHKREQDSELNEREGDDAPRIVEVQDETGVHPFPEPKNTVLRTCKVHRIRIAEISYLCPTCHSEFCLACISNVLLPEGKCIVCEAPVEIDSKFRRIIDKMVERADPGSFFSDDAVAIISPEIWRRFEELGLDENEMGKIISALKQVPPEDRLKYVDEHCKRDGHREMPP